MGKLEKSVHIADRFGGLYYVHYEGTDLHALIEREICSFSASLHLCK